MNAPAQTADEIAAELLQLSPDYAATPLLDLPDLAAYLGVAQILAKDEGRRMFGNFKSLGGTYAGLRALARVAGTDIAGLRDPGRVNGPLPMLICASDGNHGLAVAAAAQFANTPAQIFLHEGVPASRAQRIEALGAEIVWVEGTYDDAVDRAAAAARSSAGILVADTTDDPADPVVADVMAGYGVMAAEIRRQVGAAGHLRPTHLFVQAGVGGLASAIAVGLGEWMASPRAVIVTEPEAAACVAASLAQNHPVRVPGDLATTAEMLACGKASAPALAVLRLHDARAVTLPEAILAAAPRLLAAYGGPATTSSGAAGLAGLAYLLSEGRAAHAFGLNPASRVLILVTEADAAHRG